MTTANTTTTPKIDFQDSIPTFVLSAEDKLAVQLLARYENFYVQSQPDKFEPSVDEFVLSIRALRAKFEEWQKANPDRVKLPN